MIASNTNQTVHLGVSVFWVMLTHSPMKLSEMGMPNCVSRSRPDTRIELNAVSKSGLENHVKVPDEFRDGSINHAAMRVN